MPTAMCCRTASEASSASSLQTASISSEWRVGESPAWGWRMTQWAALQAKHGRAKSYAYFFAHRPAEPLTPCGYGCGAGHGAEIQYVFGNLDDRPWTKADRALSERLATTWVNFARTGNPAGKGLPAWPAFDGSAATVQHIGDVQPPIKRLPDFSPPK